jgi:exopolysaccharide production protein ExoZ
MIAIMARPETSMKVGVIGNLQILRGVAAMGVVFYHTDYRLPGDLHSDFEGVATFFVISGFIMCYISRSDPEQFFFKRVLRIVPLYWLCTLTPLVLSYQLLVRPWTWPDGFISYIVKSLLFLPMDRYPYLGVGWSLNYEMYFYLLFAVALWIHRGAAPLIAAAFVTGILALSAAGCDLFLCGYYSNWFLKFFVFGIALFYLWSTVAPRLPAIPTAVIGTLIIAFFYATHLDRPLFEPLLSAVALPMTAINTAMPVAVVAAALAMSATGADVKWRPLLLIGDASYAIYLTHTIAMTYLPSWLPAGMDSPATNTAAMLAVVAACAAIGVVVHLTVEKPVGRWLRRFAQEAKHTSLQPAGQEAAGSS